MEEEYLDGTEKGYISYRKYLAIELDFNDGVSGMKENTIRMSRCKRKTYSSKEVLRKFSRIFLKKFYRKTRKIIRAVSFEFQ